MEAKRANATIQWQKRDPRAQGARGLEIHVRRMEEYLSCFIAGRLISFLPRSLHTFPGARYVRALHQFT
jgi:hypothetical protein